MNKIYRYLFRLISFFHRLKAKIKTKYYTSISQSEIGVKFGIESEVINMSQNTNLLQIGRHSIIDGIIQIFPKSNGLRIGEYCYVGSNSRIWVANQVIIGNNVLISHNVNILDTNSHEIDSKRREKSAKKQLITGKLQVNDEIKTAPIVIKDNVWISYNVAILKGVTIGKGAIIGCNSVVSEDIPEYCLAFGNPAKPIKKIK